MVRVESIQEPDGVWATNLHDGKRSVNSGIFRMCGNNSICMAVDVDKIWTISIWCWVFVHVQAGEENGLEYGNLWRWEGKWVEDRIIGKDEIREIFLRACRTTKIINKELKVPTVHIHHIHVHVPDHNMVGMLITTSNCPIITVNCNKFPLHSLYNNFSSLHQLHQHSPYSVDGLYVVVDWKLYDLFLRQWCWIVVVAKDQAFTTLDLRSVRTLHGYHLVDLLESYLWCHGHLELLQENLVLPPIWRPWSSSLKSSILRLLKVWP